MCLRFQFCTHQRVCIIYFLKKSQIHCTLVYTAHRLGGVLLNTLKVCSVRGGVTLRGGVLLPQRRHG
jgi:hypothetical protein